jgi:hypothetical protein
MSDSERNKINTSSIRQLNFTKEHQSYCHYFAKSVDGFYEYLTESPEDASKTIKGPELDIYNVRFINNDEGMWEKTKPGCLGTIKYDFSSKVKVVKP